MPENDPAIQRAAVAVEDYIVKSKGWKEDSFEVTFNRKEGAAFVFWVIHVDDKNRMATGGGKSVAVLVDPVRNKVTKELGFQ